MGVRLFDCPPARGEGRSAEVPEDTVVYAVGDIHGRRDLLEEMQGAIATDAARRRARRRVIVYLGDYLSRGPESKGVMELVLGRRLDGFETVHLKGNHEDIILRYLDGDPAWGRHWLNYGGIEGLASYGIAARAEDAGNPAALSRLRLAFLDAFPDSHLAFVRGLGTAHREGGYLFVHAGLRPGTPIEDQDPHDLMWIRERFLTSDEDFGAVVVHGHCIVDEPEVRPNRIDIDTGAYATGILTCLVLEGNGRWLLQVLGDPVAAAATKPPRSVAWEGR
jgi:serine/threonine protein phosphatase 1